MNVDDLNEKRKTKREHAKYVEHKKMTTKQNEIHTHTDRHAHSRETKRKKNSLLLFRRCDVVVVVNVFSCFFYSCARARTLLLIPRKRIKENIIKEKATTCQLNVRLNRPEWDRNLQAATQPKKKKNHEDVVDEEVEWEGENDCCRAAEGLIS